MSALGRFLRTTPISNLNRDQENNSSPDELFVVDESVPFPDVVEWLFSHPNVSAVAVKQSDEYLGFFDIKDLISCVLALYENEEKEEDLSVLNPKLKSLKKFVDLYTTGSMAQKNAFLSLSLDSSLYDLAICFSENNIRRVPILSKNGDIIAILQEKHIIDLISENIRILQGDTSMYITNLTLGSTPVFSAKIDSSTFEVFSNIERENLTNIALLDEDCLVAALSAADVRRFVFTATRSALTSSIYSFIKAGEPSAPLLVCDNNITLAEIMKQFSIKQTGRVFVVNEKNTPVRVITLSDIIKYIC